MFKVEVETLEDYLAFDPARRGDLELWGGLMQQVAPLLTQYFHRGTPAGQPGMRFRMIGYGRRVLSSGVEWPVVGVALQKNYISVYLIDGAVLEPFRGRLGEVRMGRGNFSFVRFTDLDMEAVTGLLGEVVLRDG